MSVRILSPAKINIGLQVYPKSGEYAGFHKIESIFQTVELFDELFVEFSDDGMGRCVVSCDSMKLPAENTLTKTFDSFRKFASVNDGRSVSVSIVKRIPSGGGLGGGSSNAAFFLKALSGMYGVPLTRELSFSVAGEVGSDVFFFLGLKDGTGAALVGGRGERVSEIECRKLWFVLVFPDVFSSTKEAYSLLDRSYGILEESGESAVSDFLPFGEFEGLYRKDVSLWGSGGLGFKNSFTSVMLEVHPKIKDAISDLRETGAAFSDMSGSGSTVFGVFGDVDSAKNAVASLGSKWKCVLA